MDICALPHVVWHPKVRLSSTLSIGRDAMEMPRHLPSPHHVFVFHEADLFAMSDRIVEQVFRVMNDEPRHEFQVATRHPERALAMGALCWSSNIWFGALLDDDGSPERLSVLRNVPAAVRFAHLRPLGAVPTFDVVGLQFVIVQAAGEPAGMKSLESACGATKTRLFLGPRVDNAPVHPGAASEALAPVRDGRGEGRR